MSHFDHVANEWDSPQKIELIQKLAFKAKESLNPGKELSILDFGCGTGLFGLEFIDHARFMMGIDTSEGMLDVFSLKTRGDGRVSSKLVNLEKEDIDDRFDLIVSAMAFHHLVDPSAMLKKLSGLLNPGGKIAIVDLEQEDGSFHPDPEGMGVRHFGFSPDEIRSWADGKLNVEIQQINKLDKNEKQYGQFLAVFESKEK